MKVLFEDIRAFLKRHPFYMVVVSLGMLLAWGFSATHYTYHVDLLATDMYDGTGLIQAGRFCGPLIHTVTNWMAFAPFWHTIFMCILLVCAGLAWGALFASVSNGKILDAARLVFLCIFTTFPVLAYQGVFYPSLNIALSYLLVALALWILLQKQENETRLQLWVHRIAATCLLTCAVDMYESFAPLFLVGLFALLLVRELFAPERRNLHSLFTESMQLCSYLVVAIILDFVVSKSICFLVSGSFTFWYHANTQTAWLSMPLLDAVVWFVRKIIAQYLIGMFSNLWTFLLMCSVLLGLIGVLLFAIQKKRKICILLYIGTAFSVFSLDFVRGTISLPRMLQATAVFVGLAAMLFVVWMERTQGKKVRTVGSVFLCLICLLQTQSINQYSVENYERHEMENVLLLDIAHELSGYPIAEKPVAFVGSVTLPNILRERNTTHVVAKAFQGGWYQLWNTMLAPTGYFKQMAAIYACDANAESLICAINAKNKSWSVSFFTLLHQTEYYEAPVYHAMRRAGVKLTDCTDAQYTDATEQAQRVTFGTGEKFRILETEDTIIVCLNPNA